jgi:hypothetical protein
MIAKIREYWIVLWFLRVSLLKSRINWCDLIEIKLANLLDSNDEKTWHQNAAQNHHSVDDINMIRLDTLNGKEDWFSGDVHLYLTLINTYTQKRKSVAPDFH